MSYLKNIAAASLLSLLVLSPLTASAATVAELQAQIAALQAQLRAVNSTQTTSTSANYPAPVLKVSKVASSTISFSYANLSANRHGELNLVNTDTGATVAIRDYPGDGSGSAYWTIEPKVIATGHYRLEVMEFGTRYTSNIFVMKGIAPTCNVKVNPAKITSGSSATIVWKSTGATSAKANVGANMSEISVATTGSVRVSPTANTHYSFYFRGPNDTFALCVGKVEVGKASTTATTSLEILSPVANSSYVAGSNGPLTISWKATGFPATARILTMLENKTLNKHFVFPGDQSCQKKGNGTQSCIGKLERTAGYDLAPGTYQARVSILGEDRSDGKDAATLRTAVSRPFKLIERAATTTTSTATAPQCSVKISKKTAAVGDTYVVSWWSKNATHATDKYGDQVAAIGSQSVSSGSAGTFSYPMTFQGAGGSVQCTNSIVITAASSATSAGTQSASALTALSDALKGFLGR